MSGRKSYPWAYDGGQTPRHFGPPPVFMSEYVEHMERERIRAIRQAIKSRAQRSYARSKTGIAGHAVTAAKNTKAAAEPWWRGLIRRWPKRWDR